MLIKIYSLGGRNTQEGMHRGYKTWHMPSEAHDKLVKLCNETRSDHYVGLPERLQAIILLLVLASMVHLFLCNTPSHIPIIKPTFQCTYVHTHATNVPLLPEPTASSQRQPFPLTSTVLGRPSQRSPPPTAHRTRCHQ